MYTEQEEQKNTAEQYTKAHVIKSDENHINIEGQQFLILTSSSREALALDALAERYVSLFDVYDYLVGDWSGGQLRLKGFYEGKLPDTPIDKDIRYLEDYLTEYCSFGCDYFVLKHERGEAERIAQGASIKEKNKKKTRKRKNYSKKKKKKNRKSHSKHKFKYRDKDRYNDNNYQRKNGKTKSQNRRAKDYNKHQAFKIH